MTTSAETSSTTFVAGGQTTAAATPLLAPAPPPAPRAQPTVWGLTPTQLHDRYWASRGIQVVRQGEPSEIVRGAELFLLTASRSLVMFKLALLVERLSWDRPDLLFVRIHEERNVGYSERVLTDRQGRFVRFERIYGASDSRLARVALTKDPEIARAWQTAGDLKQGWARLRRSVGRTFRATASINGRVYDRSSDPEQAAFVRNLVRIWKRPDATIRRAAKSAGRAWADTAARIEPAAQFVGPVWVGAGRQVGGEASVVGRPSSGMTR